MRKLSKINFKMVSYEEYTSGRITLVKGDEQDDGNTLWSVYSSGSYKGVVWINKDHVDKMSAKDLDEVYDGEEETTYQL